LAAYKNTGIEVICQTLGEIVCCGLLYAIMKRKQTNNKLAYSNSKVEGILSMRLMKSDCVLYLLKCI